MTVQIAGKTVLQDVNLVVTASELAVLMGPNGSGKSSLAATLVGHPDYEVIAGEIIFNNLNITKLLPHERAKLGLFIAFQNPKAIPGLQVFSFLKTIYESYTGNVISVPDFEVLLDQNLNLVGLNKSFIYRDVNVGFSGGETKRFEILQLLLLQPKLIIIDEIDSGLDLDALKMIANALSVYHHNHSDAAIILITHYRRILDFLAPEVVHILSSGKLIKSGNLDLVTQLEQAGYDSFI